MWTLIRHSKRRRSCHIVDSGARSTLNLNLYRSYSITNTCRGFYLKFYLVCGQGRAWQSGIVIWFSVFSLWWSRGDFSPNMVTYVRIFAYWKIITTYYRTLQQRQNSKIVGPGICSGISTTFRAVPSQAGTNTHVSYHQCPDPVSMPSVQHCADLITNDIRRKFVWQKWGDNTNKAMVFALELWERAKAAWRQNSGSKILQQKARAADFILRCHNLLDTIW